MSKQKLLSVNPRSSTTRQLQSLLIAYHHFRQERGNSPLNPVVQRIEQWQGSRLRHTHRDLYEHPRYRQALDFLLNDLYSPTQFTRRDDDLERIFPVMVKMVPEGALGTVARLVELNLLTQQLDLALAATLLERYPDENINEARYTECFRISHQLRDRQQQIDMILAIGHELESYVTSRFLSFSLGVTEGAANMAGLGQLHSFLRRGMIAFRSMGQVGDLLQTITGREHALLDRIHAGETSPFGLETGDNSAISPA
jgi:hypothetical protein